MVYHSLKEFAEAQGVKVKAPKSEKARKCPKCGDPMVHIEGTNVYLCNHVDLTDDELKGQPVQVFRKCGNWVFA